MLKETFSVIFTHRAPLGIFCCLGHRRGGRIIFFIPVQVFTCLWAAPCQSSVSSAVNHVEMEMFVPQSTNPTDISSLLPSSSSLSSFSASICVLLVTRRVCPLKKLGKGHPAAWWPSAECHISIIQRAIFWPLSLSLSLAISKLSERWIHLCRGGNDWWKTSFPDFRINTACSPGLTGRCFMFATVMHHVTKILEGQDKGQLYVRWLLLNVGYLERP